MPNKFFLPNITAAVRSITTLLKGEVRYDTTQKIPYFGDGLTVGGKALETKATTPTKTANYIAKSGEEIPCNTSGGAFSITTPASGTFKVVDVGGNTATTGFGASGKKLTILPASGTTIYGDTFLDLAVGGIAPEFELIRTDWRVINRG